MLVGCLHCNYTVISLIVINLLVSCKNSTGEHIQKNFPKPTSHLVSQVSTCSLINLKKLPYWTKSFPYLLHATHPHSQTLETTKTHAHLPNRPSRHKSADSLSGSMLTIRPFTMIPHPATTETLYSLLSLCSL